MSTDWNFVIDTIRRKKCVLFVGPQIYAGSDGTTLEEALCRALDARNPGNPLIRAYYEDDNFFLFRENKFKSRVISQLRDFFSQPFPEAETIFEKISEIPFSVVVTMTPDRLLSGIMTRKGLEHQCDFYHFGRSARPLDAPISDLPMLYNLLGWLEEDESLVLTHNDFFGYLEAVFTGGKMNLELKTELLQAKNYIFLGLPFGKWYMQLILRVLGLHNEGTEFDSISPNPSLSPPVRQMYEEQFKIQFVEENIQSFVDELHKQCSAKNLLRASGGVPGPAQIDTLSLDSIVDFVAYAETDKALEALRNYLQPLRSKGPKLAGYHTDCILLMSRFEELEKKAQRGVTYTQEDQVERAKINYDLLALINRIREVGGPQGAAAPG